MELFCGNDLETLGCTVCCFDVVIICMMIGVRFFPFGCVQKTGKKINISYL